jgi:exonuclease III
MGGTSEQCKKIENMFLTNSSKQTDFLYNSSKNSRGVGVLIDHSIQYSVNKILKDPDENIIVLHITIDKCNLILAGIYGPNSNSKDFFSNLRTYLDEFKGTPMILGGDWNTTYSTGSIRQNIDIYSMSSPPSTLRSGWLHELCMELDLLDPFRALHPTAREFTFIPRGIKKTGHV